MTKDDVLKLFQDRALTLGVLPATQTDIISRFAQVLADSGDKLPDAEREELILIGAKMYQEASGKIRASAEVSATMKKSTRSRKDN